MLTWIKNGLVIDPANGVREVRDLWISDGRIASEPDAQPDRVIDASGCVVCPGFIDIHMHEDPVAEGRIQPNIFLTMLRMGVTTAVGGNCGLNVYDPVEYLKLVDRDGAPVNLALFAGHEFFRHAAGGMDRYAPLDDVQIERLCRGIGAALAGGCVGLSLGLRYVPGTDARELKAALDCCVPLGRQVSVHLRDDADQVFAAIDEVAEPCKQRKLRLQISHIGSMAGFGQMEAALKQIDDYRAEGLDVACDCYPYFAFSTRIGETTYDDGWLERYHCDYGACRMAEGKYAGQACTAETFAEVRRDFPECITVCNVMREADVRMALAHPWVLLASDGLLDGDAGHPRAAGTFPRYLRDFAGDELYEGIRKCSALPAQRLGLANKGRLNPGADADVVIFDPAQLRDRATFDEPTLAPEGVEWVFVAGEPALHRGEIVNANLGRAVRA